MTPAIKTKQTSLAVKGKATDTPATALFYTAGVLALALFLLYLSSALVPRPGTLRLFLDYFFLQLLLSLVNVVLILYLFYIYAKDYLELHSGFTGGLLLFLTAMLLYSLTSNPVIRFWFDFRSGPDLLDIVPLAFSTLALVVLAKISGD